MISLGIKATPAVPQLPYLHIAALAAFGVLAAFCAASLARKRKSKI